MAEQDTSGYIGVDPEYQNYANETERPLISKEDTKILKLIESDTEFVDAKSVDKSEDKEEPKAPTAPKAPAPSVTEK